MTPGLRGGGFQPAYVGYALRSPMGTAEIRQVIRQDRALCRFLDYHAGLGESGAQDADPPRR